MSKFIPRLEGKLRGRTLKVPDAIYGCSGISINGKRLKSALFSTDVSIIRNTNADSVIAVYPFTPQPIITRGIMTVADIPVFCGVGGGLTGGERAVVLSVEAELQGAIGLVLNAPTPNTTIELIAKKVDVPIVITVVSEKDDFESRLSAGASIFNVSGAKNTAKIVRRIRETFPEVPIIATGGPTDETIKETIEAGANMITWTPPTSAEIFAGVMEKYREEKDE